MTARYRKSLVWLRRDLRLDDNAALAAAAAQSAEIVMAFVLSPALLQSERTGAPLVHAFFHALASLRAALRERGSDLVLLEGDFAHELQAYCIRTNVQAVFFNEDYEPDALTRDAKVSEALRTCGIDVHASLDHVYFGAAEIVQSNGTPYSVFTPYKRRWLEYATVSRRLPFQSERAARQKLARLEAAGPTREVPRAQDYGFGVLPDYATPDERGAAHRLQSFLQRGAASYSHDRDFPGIAGTSSLSADLRAGTIGIRTCVEGAFSAGADTWLSELIWRDFYQMILRSFPRVATGPFREAASGIQWRDAPRDFARWCAGETGYPIVDAAMLQLNRTGWMHNRLRMVTASFLTKHLLIDWRLGERYFERHLSDADLASNNGGWQWSASTGNDPVPYFRIFNPVLQGRKFDPDGAFVRAMLPQFERIALPFVHEPWKSPEPIAGYPTPIVEHRFARERALAEFSRAMKRNVTAIPV